MTEAFGVSLQAAEKRFGEFLTIVGFLEQSFLARIAQEADLRQHRGHPGADQNNEGRLADAAVLSGRDVAARKLVKARLDTAGELARLFGFVVQGVLLMMSCNSKMDFSELAFSREATSSASLESVKFR